MLTTILMSYEGGRLKGHILRSMAPLREQPAYQRLSDFFQRAPRLSQYLVRLIEQEENAALRTELRARIAADPDQEARLSLLPKGLRTLLEGSD